MIINLLYCKRLYMEAAKYAEYNDSFSSGLAISLLQDSIELYLWTLIKEKNIAVKDKETFEGFLEIIPKNNVTINNKAHLQQLNKARVNFKHYGNLPAPEESLKFIKYTELFFIDSFKIHYNIEFNEMTITDIVPFNDVKEYLKKAEIFLIENKFENSSGSAAIAKEILFSKFNNVIPKVDYRLSGLDDLFNNINNIGRFDGFGYIQKYLESLRENIILLHLKVDHTSYLKLRSKLPRANQTMNHKWHYILQNNVKYNAELCKFFINTISELSIKLVDM